MILGFFLAYLSIALMIGGLYGLVGLLWRLQELFAGGSVIDDREQDFEEYEQELDGVLPFALHPECFDSDGNIIKEPWMFFVFKRVEE